MRSSEAVIAFAVFGCAASLRSSGNPVTRVVRLLDEMKEQVEGEAKEDKEVFENHDCWCETNERTKTVAVQNAKESLDDLAAAIEEGNARNAELKVEIETAEQDIAEDKSALQKAEQLRERERTEFDAQSQESMEAITAMKDALEVLSKVQFAQQSPPQQAFVQVKDIVARAKLLKPARAFMYKSVLQRDLWDVLGSMDGGSGHVVAGLEQQPSGNAAGAKSHNSRSGQIVGILSEMKDEFERDLSASQKAEMEAEISFQKLQATKGGEIQAASGTMEVKSEQLADSTQKVAQAKVDVEDTRKALAADEQFLVDLEDRCKNADAEYATRQQTRQDEILAISETINMITGDEAKDLFSRTKSLSLLQIKSRRHVLPLNSPTRSQVAAHLLQTAQKYSAWQLATLAVSVSLDGFEKVKATIDNMIVKLKQQQSDEVAKKDTCDKNIDDNEDATRVKNTEKKHLTAEITELGSAIEQITTDLDDLKADIADMQLSLKRAGEDRKAQNREFQQTVADQRATVVILNKALARLKQFYEPKMLVQKAVQLHRQSDAAVEPPPAAGKEYSKNAGAGGVTSTIEMIIQDAEKADEEALAAEQDSQAAYAEMIKNTNEMLDTAQEGIAQKSKEKETAESDKDLAEQSLMAAVDALEDLHGVNTALHKGCDYIIKYFNIRQQARQKEIESIQAAKAILSGADFGL